MPPEYLDTAATTPVSERVAAVVMHYMTVEFGNAGSRTHRWGNEAKKAVQRARAEIAAQFDVGPDELNFTSGATESNNLAILGLESYGRESGRMHIVSSVTEHKAVLEPLKRLADRGFEVELLSPGESGRFAPEAILDRVREDTLLVSLMHVNNETGVIQPIAELAEALAATETLFHVDAAQGFTKTGDGALRSPIDLISISGHKIGGPKGVGGLVARRRRWNKPPLEPLMVGGGQERGLRPGTLPVPLLMGLAEAVCERIEVQDAWRETSMTKRKEMLYWAEQRGGILNGDQTHMVPHILNVAFPGRDAEGLILELQDEMAIASGSACTSSSYTHSHVLEGMGLGDSVLSSAVRLSW